MWLGETGTNFKIIHETKNRVFFNTFIAHTAHERQRLNVTGWAVIALNSKKGWKSLKRYTYFDLNF